MTAAAFRRRCPRGRVTVNGLTAYMAWLRSDIATTRRRHRRTLDAWRRALRSPAADGRSALIANDVTSLGADLDNTRALYTSVRMVRDFFYGRVDHDEALGPTHLARCYTLATERYARRDSEEFREEYEYECAAWAKARELLNVLRSRGTNWRSLDAFEGAMDTRGPRALLTHAVRGLAPYTNSRRVEDAEDLWADLWDIAESAPRQEDYERALYDAVAPALRPRPRWGEYMRPPGPQSMDELESLAAAAAQALGLPLWAGGPVVLGAAPHHD